jgi:hypothetical protein
MTQKTASGRMGRNPFLAKPTPRSARHILDELDEITAASKADRFGTNRWLERAVALPVRSVVFGLKSLLVVRYLVAHPGAWKI